MRGFITFLLLVTFCWAEAQDREASTWLYKLDVPHMIYGFAFPKVQISAEKKITPTFSIIGEIGYQFYSNESVDTVFVNPRGFRLSVESRIYISQFYDKERKRKHSGLFAGVEGFYRGNQQNNSVRYYAGESDNVFVDEFVVRKRVYGINLTTGYQLTFPRKKYFLVLEPHLGFGVMNKFVRNEQLDFVPGVDEDLYSHHYVLPDQNFESSAGFQFNFNIGVRFGFQLRKSIK
ncbi:MAG: hypothetical protein ITG00_11700 [Flavobacterium sp.]|nr:hypothetical protein [Flavobacterium sp.]